MLTAIRDSDQSKVLARASEKVHAPFACPACQREVTLRKGNIRTHHFAHKPPISCRDAMGETEDHLLTKLSIFDALKLEPNVVAVELEKRFETSIADVYAVISGVPVAIEIQRSILTPAEINARTSNYHRLGIAVIWVGIPNSDLGMSRYSPAAWERWAHAAYFGRVYYWAGGQTLRPVHFGPYMLQVEYQSWRKHGEEHSAGGYEKHSKRWRTPQAGQLVKLSTDFRRTRRDAWAGGSVQVPESTLYVDRLAPWWSK